MPLDPTRTGPRARHDDGIPPDPTDAPAPGGTEERSQLARDTEVLSRIFEFAPDAKPRLGLLPAACVRARGRS